MAVFFKFFTWCEGQAWLQHVEIDGTETGGFGALPSFQREDVLIPPLRSQHSASQYLLVKEPEREAVRLLCRMSLRVQPGLGYDNCLREVEMHLNNLAASGSKMATRPARLLALQNLVRSYPEKEVDELLAPFRELVSSLATLQAPRLHSLCRCPTFLGLLSAGCFGLCSICTKQGRTKAQTWRRQKYQQPRYGGIYICCC
jgi:hypothetical protein